MSFLFLLSTALITSPLLGAKFVRSMTKTLPNRVCLHNSRTEYSQIIKVALDIIYTQSFDSNMVQEKANLIRFVIQFAKDWEITLITSLIQKQLRKDIESGSDTSSLFNQFLVALDLGDNELAAQYFASPESAEWEAQEGSVRSDDESCDEMDEDEEEEEEEEEQEGLSSEGVKMKDGAGSEEEKDKVS